MNIIRDIKDRLLGTNTMTGLEIQLSGSGEAVFYLVVLQRTKGLIQIESIQTLNNIEDVLQKIDPSVPVAVGITGKGVISKKIAADTINNADLETGLVEQLFPNANPEDFYLQYYVSGKNNFASVVRKNSADVWLNKLKIHHVIGLSLGGIPLLNLTTVLDNQQAIKAGKHELSLEGAASPTAYKYFPDNDNTPIRMGDETIDGVYGLTYALALQQLVAGLVNIEVADKAFINEREEFRQRKLFHVGKWAALLFLFVLLGGNFFVYSSLKNETETLRYQVNRFKGILAESDSLSNETEYKASFLTSAGWMGPANLSYFADRIAAAVPSSVTLNGININPVDETASREQRKMIFTTGRIKISGTCVQATEINPWVNDLKKQAWVKDVAVKDYKFDKRDKTGEFLIEITL